MSADQPPVTVIIPVFNRQDFLREAIRSVQNQTYTDWELIIVDDASTDKSFAIAQQASSLDSRITAFKLPTNSGNPALPRNMAMDLARGRYIAMLDSDDLWHPEKLERQIAFMHEKNAAVSYTDYYRLSTAPARTQRLVRVPDKTNFQTLMVGPGVNPSNIMIDTKQTGIIRFDQNAPIEDTEFFIRLFKKHDGYGLHTPLLYSRHGGHPSITSRKLRFTFARCAHYGYVGKKFGMQDMAHHFGSYCVGYIKRKVFNQQPQ